MPDELPNQKSDEKSAMTRIRIIKVGGSLLRNMDSIERVRTWLESEQVSGPKTDVVLTGGGEYADWVRDWDRDCLLGNCISHRLAIDAMSFQLGQFHRLFPNTPIARQLNELTKHLDRSCMFFFDPRDWILGLPDVPATWDFTSDSIAACLARSVDASELVLLKSTLPPVGATISDAALLGMVDACFSDSAAGIETVTLTRLSPDGQAVSWTPRSYGVNSEQGATPD
jgi:aspartokinase-like uncharacterized kinase